MLQWIFFLLANCVLIELMGWFPSLYLINLLHFRCLLPPASYNSVSFFPPFISGHVLFFSEFPTLDFLLTKATFQVLYLREIGSLTTMSYAHHSCSLLILCLICHTGAEHWHDVQGSELLLCDWSLGTNVINQNNNNKLQDNLAVST